MMIGRIISVHKKVFLKFRLSLDAGIQEPSGEEDILTSIKKMGNDEDAKKKNSNKL